MDLPFPLDNPLLLLLTEVRLLTQVLLGLGELLLLLFDEGGSCKDAVPLLLEGLADVILLGVLHLEVRHQLLFLGAALIQFEL